jgi:hypothetical protein
MLPPFRQPAVEIQLPVGWTWLSVTGNRTSLVCRDRCLLLVAALRRRLRQRSVVSRMDGHRSADVVAAHWLSDWGVAGLGHFVGHATDHLQAWTPTSLGFSIDLESGEPFQQLPMFFYCCCCLSCTAAFRLCSFWAGLQF